MITNLICRLHANKDDLTMGLCSKNDYYDQHKFVLQFSLIRHFLNLKLEFCDKLQYFLLDIFTLFWSGDAKLHLKVTNLKFAISFGTIQTFIIWKLTYIFPLSFMSIPFSKINFKGILLKRNFKAICIHSNCLKYFCFYPGLRVFIKYIHPRL